MPQPEPEPRTKSSSLQEEAILTSGTATSEIELGHGNFGQEIWSGCRPYLIVIARDTIISLCLYVVMVGFHYLVSLFPVPGWEGQWVQNIHGVGILGAFMLFAWLIVKDLYKLQKEQ